MTDNGEEMRDYWDERARINPLWYVDTSLRFDSPDMEKFFESGRRTVDYALSGSPFSPPANSLAVEIGSGLGRMCVALAERFDRVVGYDISPEMVERAQALVANDRISFLVGDGSSLHGIEDSMADVVISFTVFQHIPRMEVIQHYIREAARVLRRGGLFVFQWNNTPGAIRWVLRRSVLSFLQRTGIGERYGRNHPAFLGSRVPLARIERTVERSGMALRRTEGLGDLFAWAWAEKVE